MTEDWGKTHVTQHERGYRIGQSGVEMELTLKPATHPVPPGRATVVLHRPATPAKLCLGSGTNNAEGIGHDEEDKAKPAQDTRPPQAKAT